MCRVLTLAALSMCYLVGPTAGAEKIVLDSRGLTIRFEVRSFGAWPIAGRFGEARGEIAFAPAATAAAWSGRSHGPALRP